MILKKEIIDFIRKKIDLIRKEEQIVNAVIREDVFSILERKCIVCYFPIDDHNKGFHDTRYIKDVKYNFVFINTSHPTENQIFCAAHELGHILNMDKSVEKHFGISLTYEESERIMNRFAAELLMPEDPFNIVLNSKVEELEPDRTNNTIYKDDFFKLITYLMDYFFVPFNSVLYRLQETGHITDDLKNKFLIEQENHELTQIVKIYVSQGQYTRLLSPNKIKKMGELPKLLKKAKNENLMPDSFIENIKQKFDINENVLCDKVLDDEELEYESK